MHHFKASKYCIYNTNAQYWCVADIHALTTSNKSQNFIYWIHLLQTKKWPICNRWAI